MSFLRPIAAQIIARVQADIESKLTGADAKLRRTVEGVLARVMGGVSHGLHGHIQHTSRQIIPSTQNDEETATDHGEFWLGEDGRKPADVAAGSELFTGTPTTNIIAGTLLTRADGSRVSTDALGIIDGGGSISIAVTAEEAGDDGNAAVGTTYTLVNPIAGVDSAATVEDDGDGGGLTDGTDVETIEALIGRVELRVQTPPRGGADGDYEEEMLKVAGVTRGWEHPGQLGPGTMLLTFVMDNQTPSIIPGAPKVAEVQAAIDLWRPTTAITTVAAPTAIDLDASIQLQPNTAAVRAAVDAELTDYLQRNGDDNATLLISEINEAISLAQGEEDHILILPAANKAHAVGEVPVLGTTVFAPIP